jgi:hypothetical protein
MSNAQVSYFSGTTTSNDLTLPHLTLNPNRILANFDYEKYSYIQNLQLKNSDLAKHYLDQGPTLQQAFQYARVNSVLEFFSYIHNSGISGRTYPRRDVTKLLESTFSKFKKTNQILLINVSESDLTNDKWKDYEVEVFKQVLASYFNNSEIFTLEVSRENLGLLKVAVKNSWPDLITQVVIMVNTETSDMEILGTLISTDLLDKTGSIIYLNHIYPLHKNVLDSALMGLSISLQDVVSCQYQSAIKPDKNLNIASAIAIEWNRNT